MPEAQALRDALDNASVTNDELQTKLKGFREARKKNDESLKKAREDLRKVLSLKQEARLVLFGLLD